MMLRLWMSFLWFVAGSANTENMMIFSECYGATEILARKELNLTISAHTENGKDVLTDAN